MTDILKNLKPAKRYAKALMELSSGENSAEICKNLEFILNIINENPEFCAFLNNPVIKKDDKTAVLSEIFSKISDDTKALQTNDKTQDANTQTLNFLNLLIENNRINILPDVIKCLQDDINESKNAIKAGITSVIELNDEEKNRLLEKLRQKTNMEILPDFSIDKDILGGIIIKINDTVIDLSVKKRIENLKTLKDKYER